MKTILKIALYYTMITIPFIFSTNAFANCRGCCSKNGGVTCSNSLTMCKDNTSLSVKCQNKGCNECAGNKIDMHYYQQSITKPKKETFNWKEKKVIKKENKLP